MQVKMSIRNVKAELPKTFASINEIVQRESQAIVDYFNDHSKEVDLDLKFTVPKSQLEKDFTPGEDV